MMELELNSKHTYDELNSRLCHELNVVRNTLDSSKTQSDYFNTKLNSLDESLKEAHKSQESLEKKLNAKFKKVKDYMFETNELLKQHTETLNSDSAKNSLLQTKKKVEKLESVLGDLVKKEVKMR